MEVMPASKQRAKEKGNVLVEMEKGQMSLTLVGLWRRQTAATLDGSHARSSVVEHAGEHHADDARAASRASGPEQGVYGSL
jgi:hypothetical protein